MSNEFNQKVFFIELPLDFSCRISNNNLYVYQIIVGYWKIRGIGAALRMLCEYAQVDYTAKNYEVIVKGDGRFNICSRRKLPQMAYCTPSWQLRPKLLVWARQTGINRRLRIAAWDLTLQYSCSLSVTHLSTCLTWSTDRQAPFPCVYSCPHADVLMETISAGNRSIQRLPAIPWAQVRPGR